MTAAVAGIDPHQDQFTIGVVDGNGAGLGHATFANTGAGYAEALDFLTGHAVGLVGIEGSASWGAHVSVALVAAGLDAREVPTGRSAAQRRARRQAKTDTIDAYSAARALLADPDLGPAQALEIYDPLLAQIEAVLEHRRMLVELRTLRLHHVQAQLSKLPTDIRDQVRTTGKVESRLRALQGLDLLAEVSTIAGAYRLSWLVPLVAADRDDRAEIRRLERLIDTLLDEHGTTLRDEPGIGPIAAATLLVEVGDPQRFATEARFARWCGTGAVAISSGEGDDQPVRHRLDLRGNRRVNSMLHIASVTQQRDHQPAQDYLRRKRASGKTRREARRAHKRHLANRVIRRMWNDEKHRLNAPSQLAA
jgi:transposase